MKNINEKKTHCVNHRDKNYSLIGMRREQPIGWWLKKLFKSFNIDVITNPYIYEEYVRTEGKGPDFLIPDLGIAIEAKGLSKYLKNGDKQYVSREWLTREVIGGEVKEKGKIKLYSSRYPVGYNNKHVIFQWGSTCPQKHVDWMREKHDIVTISPNIDLDHIWENKHDLMKFKRFLYRNFVAPYKSLLKKIKKLRDNWGDEWRLHYNLNSIRYKSNTLSSILTRDDDYYHDNDEEDNMNKYNMHNEYNNGKKPEKLGWGELYITQYPIVDTRVSKEISEKKYKSWSEITSIYLVWADKNRIETII